MLELRGKQTLGMPFLISILTPTHTRSTFPILKKRLCYIRNATPWTSKPTGLSWASGCQPGRGAFIVPGLCADICNPRESCRTPNQPRCPPPTLPALGPTPCTPALTHRTLSLGRKVADAAIPVSESFSKICRQRLVNPKDLWREISDAGLPRDGDVPGEPRDACGVAVHRQHPAGVPLSFAHL